MRTTKVIRAGRAFGVVIPQDVLAAMAAKPGDDVLIEKTSDGFTVRAMTAEVRAEVEAGRKIMQRYRQLKNAKSASK